MKVSTGAVLAAAATLASAQVSYNFTSNQWDCPVPNGSYCSDPSLTNNIIILCVNGVGQVGNCSGHVQDRPPIDVYWSPCWEISPEAGNATCSKNCTVWPDMGEPYGVPGDCNYSEPSYGSDIVGYGLNVTYSGNSSSNSSVTLSSTPTPTSSSSSGSGSGSPAKSQAAAVPLPRSFYTASTVFALALAAAVLL